MNFYGKQGSLVNNLHITNIHTYKSDFQTFYINTERYVEKLCRIVTKVLCDTSFKLLLLGIGGVFLLWCR